MNQPSLFDLGTNDVRYPDRIKKMWQFYGRSNGNFCQSCVHLLRIRHGRTKTYLKCDKTMMSHGPGTDWKAGFPACGAFQSKP